MTLDREKFKRPVEHDHFVEEFVDNLATGADDINNIVQGHGMGAIGLAGLVEHV
jgi:hypothetical protein